jgi:hypothetical protein
MLGRVRRFNSHCPCTDKLRHDTPAPRMVGPRLVIRIISGDAALTESLIEKCKGCHVLIHDAYSQNLPHSGWRGSVIDHSERRSNNGLARQVVLGSLRDIALQGTHRLIQRRKRSGGTRLKCSIRDCLRDVSRLRKGCFVPIFRNLTHLHHVSFSQGL